MKFKYNISIIGGAGHVGFPLGLIFASKKLKVNLIDKNSYNLSLIKKGKCPFKEDLAPKYLIVFCLEKIFLLIVLILISLYPVDLCLLKVKSYALLPYIYENFIFRNF